MPVLVKNKNRFRKVYPGIRKNSVDEALYPVKIEAGKITLNNSNSGIYTFSYSYGDIPAVTVSVYSTTDDSNTVAYIESISKTEVTVSTSTNITGTLYVQVIEVIKT